MKQLPEATTVIGKEEDIFLTVAIRPVEQDLLRFFVKNTYESGLMDDEPYDVESRCFQESILLIKRITGYEQWLEQRENCRN